MMPESVSFPLSFYLIWIVVVFFGWRAWQARQKGWGIPMLAVLGTAGAWYLGDALYNDYNQYDLTFGEGTLLNAWWEVLLFFVSFGIMVPIVHRQMNSHLMGGESRIFQMVRDRGIESDAFQQQITILAGALLGPWLILMGLGLFRTNFDFIGLFFPYLGEKSDPWARDRIGTGFDAVYAFAGYIQLMLTALWGALFALSKRPGTMCLSGLVYFLSAPFYIFDRTRSYMLAILLPGFMAFVALRMRSGMVVRMAVVVVSFIALQGWMKFVLDNRGQTTISEAFKTGGTQDLAVKSQKHLGFNMFEELAYINYFIANGAYKVNWGTRYFAEIVNPIPRVLWPGKPMIGIDYAIARGMKYGEQAAKSGGIAASISTGMIGQGVVNFGRILGPITSALLMAIWVAVLARMDLMGGDPGHLLLYAIGLVLTYNMGRDITLLILYPFIFGWILVNLIEKQRLRPAVRHEA